MPTPRCCPTARLLWILGAICLPTAACEPARVDPSAACKTDSDCPAGSQHRCNPTTLKCEICAGGCPVDAVGGDGVGLTDAVTSDVGAADTAGTTDAGKVIDTWIYDVAATSSCKGLCGNHAVTCFCDPGCVATSTCCVDYAQWCVTADAN